MSSRRERVNTRSLMREQQVNNANGTPSEHQRVHQSTAQPPPMVPQSVSAPPMIDLDAIEDDDVVESTASAFNRAKRHKSGGARRGSSVVDVESGSTTTRTKENRTRPKSEPNVSRKSSKAVATVEEPKFNCPICMCAFTEEVSTKCGHIFCKSCITSAISCQAKCPTCRKKVTAKDLIRIFLPATT